MEQKSQENEKTQSTTSTSTLTSGEMLWKKLQEMPYDESQVGQAFIMSWTPPKNATTPSSSGKKTDESGEVVE